MAAERIDVDVVVQHSWADKRDAAKGKGAIIRYRIQCTACKAVGPVFYDKRHAIHESKTHAMQHATGEVHY